MAYPFDREPILFEIGMWRVFVEEMCRLSFAAAHEAPLHALFGLPFLDGCGYRAAKPHLHPRG